MPPSFLNTCTLVIRSKLTVPWANSLRCAPQSQHRWKSTFPTTLYNSLSKTDQEKVLELRALRQAARNTRAAGVGLSNLNCAANRYSQQEDDFLLHFVKAQCSFAEISKTLDRSISGLWARYTDYLRYKDPEAPSLPRTPHASKTSAEDETTAMIVQLANKGVPFLHIGFRLGISARTVRRRYNRACPSEDRNTGDGCREISDHDVDLIRARSQQGASLYDMAIETGRSIASIQHIVKRAEMCVTRGGTSTYPGPDASRSAVATGSSPAKQMEMVHDPLLGKSRLLPSEPSPSRTRQKRWTSRERSEALRLHGLGHNVLSIATQLGRDWTGVRRALRKELERVGSDPSKPRQVWRSNRIAQLVELREIEALNWSVIATKMNTTTGSVQQKYYKVLKARSCVSVPELNDDSSPVAADC